MSGVFSLIVILVPLLLIIGLTVFFIRLFKKTSAKEHDLVKEMASLEAMKRNAVWRDAKITGVQAELPSRLSPAKRVLNLKLEIKDEKDDNYRPYSARWRVDTLVISSLRPDNIIRVKVYNQLVFPTIEGADIYL